MTDLPLKKARQCPVCSNISPRERNRACLDVNTKTNIFCIDLNGVYLYHMCRKIQGVPWSHSIFSCCLLESMRCLLSKGKIRYDLLMTL
jgi:hypothetical protein